MLCFLKKVLLFSLPLGLLFVFPGTVLYFGREYVAAEDVVTSQQKDPRILMSFAYNPTLFVPYKLALMKEKNPTVVSLGTSRVLQIRKEFFINQESYVDAGKAGGSLDDIKYFVEQLPEDTHVKVIILGLDNETLYETFESKNFRIEQPFFMRAANMIALMSRRIYLDYFAHKYSLFQLMKAYKSSSNIGLIALVSGDGFRPDGSYKYSQSQSNQYLQEEVKADIEKKAEDLRRSSLQSGDTRYQEVEINLEKLSSVLELCKKRGITVVGFTPPYPEVMYNAMIDKGGFDKDILVTVPKRVSDIFSKYGNPFFNLSLVNTFGGNENEFVDPVHGTDGMYLHMMIYMAEHSDILRNYVSLKDLRSLLPKEHRGFLNF